MASGIQLLTETNLQSLFKNLLKSSLSLPPSINSLCPVGPSGSHSQELPLGLETKAGSFNPLVPSLLCTHKSKGMGFDCRHENMSCWVCLYACILLLVRVCIFIVEGIFCTTWKCEFIMYVDVYIWETNKYVCKGLSLPATMHVYSLAYMCKYE